MEKKYKKVWTICIIIFLILISLAIYFYNETALSMNLILIGIIILFFPYGVIKFLEYKKIKAYEESFPNFLRDIAESQRAGLSIIEAIKAASKTDYGSLSNEIIKMNNQLSWNIPLSEVLLEFKNRTKTSKNISKAVMVIIEANKTGGNIEDIMDSLANNIESIKDVEDEKKMLMSQHVMMIYAIFFIFVGISIALIKFLVPALNVQGKAEFSTFGLMGGFNANPCYSCISNTDPACLGCNIFFTISDTFGFGAKEEPSSYYRSLFFAMIIIQGIFGGLMAGQIGSDSVTAGLKHSMIMLLMGIIIFISIVKIGFV